MADRECSRGWILSPSKTDGEYVPFFVLVRDKDIIWDEDHLPEKLRNLTEAGTDVILDIPMYQWRCKIGNWDVTLNQDGTYRATQYMNVQDNGSFIDSNTILLHLNLPFETNNDSKLFVNTLSCATVTDIKTAHTNMVKPTDDYFQSLDIELLNYMTVFYSDFETNSYYRNQFMVVTVEGSVHFAE